MKKVILSLLLAAAAALGAQAQLLWQVKMPGAKTTSYVFGTHHLAPLTMLDSVAGFNDALQSVDRVIGEVDMEQMAAAQQGLMGYMLAPADSTLTALLTKEQTDSLTTLLQRYMGPQISAAQLAMLKPAAVATQLAMFEAMATLPQEQMQQLASGQQLDSEVQNRARAMGKKIGGFETPEQQMELLMGAPLAKQARELMKAVAEGLEGKSAADAQKLTQAYMAQDLDALAELIFADETTDTQRLIYDRNANWATQLSMQILPVNNLIVVGAGHLPGPKGLLALLRNMGFEVTPVK